jgi:hypothetical protein
MFSQIQRGWIVAQNGCERLGRRGSFESTPAAQHLVQHDTKCEDVGAGIGGFAPYLLGRHVALCTEHDARLSVSEVTVVNPGGAPTSSTRAAPGRSPGS